MAAASVTGTFASSTRTIFLKFQTDRFVMTRRRRSQTWKHPAGILQLLISLGIFIAPNASAQMYIFGRADFPTVNTPNSVIVGDFNGDGKSDLAVADYSAVSVLLGNGDGTFQSQIEYTIGTYTPDLAAADFNGDGKLDLAVASQTDSSVVVLLGKGDGTFSAGPVIPVLNPPQKIIVADFNGDKKLDVATVNSTDVMGSSYNSVSVLLGKGDGTFASPIEYPMDGATFSIAAGDFNGDGKLDLAVGNPGLAVLSILVGNGDGTFQAPVNYGSGTGNYVASSLVIGDLNGDGKLDIASCGGSQVSVFLGNGDGTFQTHVNYGEGGSDAGWLTAADFNGDGKLDLAVSNGYGGGYPVPTISVLLGKGDGTFQPYVDYFTGGQPYSVTASDLNGDGKPDLVSATAANSVMVLIGKGDGTFSKPGEYVGGSVPMGVTSGDFNADGKPDLAVANRGDNTVSVFLGGGDGSFAASVSYPAGPSARAVSAADLNGNNRDDLVVADPSCSLIFPPCSTTGSVSVLTANADGTFNAAVSYPVNGYPVSVATGDFNRDGKVDVVVANANSPGTVSVFLGNGDGTLQSPIDYASAQQPMGVAVGDVNGDGKLDLVVASASGTTGGTASILLGNGDGTFQTHVDHALGNQPISILTADFNGDGKLDLAAANNSSSMVSVLLGVGDGTFQNQVTYYAAYVEPTGLTTGDFNGDGHLDLAVVNGLDNTIALLLGKGDGTFPTLVTYEYGGLSGESYSLTTADFLGQNASDLAIANFAGGGGNSVSVLLNSSIAALFPSQLSFSPLAVGSSSTSQQLQLTNPGAVPLTISSIVTMGDFSEDNACGATLAVGSNCIIDVTFTPTGPLSRSGTVVLTDNAFNTPENIPLTGTGIGPATSFSPPSLDFSGQFIGNSSSAQTITLSNSGNATLQISTIGISGDFAETNNCPSSIAAEASCSITLTFAPTAPGARNGNLTVADNAPGSPQTVTLSGAGMDFSIALAAGSSNSASVAPGGTATYNLAVTPEGGLNGTVTLACSGSPSEAQCSISPASIKLDGSTAVNAAITVNTTAASQLSPHGTPRSTMFNLRSAPWQIWFLALLIFWSGAAIIGRNPQRRHSRSLPPFFAILLLSLTSVSCGGSGTPSVHDPGTPAGSYSLSVNAMFSSGSVNLQHRVDLMLTVN